MRYAPPTDPWLLPVYEDRDLLVIDKPAGLLSVPGRQPGWQDSAATRVAAQRAHSYPVHRLDMDTSGLLIFALRRKAERALKAAFQQRRVTKRYLARVWGHPPDSGRIDLPLARLGGLPPRNGVDPAGRRAVTGYTVLRRDADTALVELRPETGRSHQLRVHMQAAGYPIVGDRLYAPPAIRHRADRLLLHAWRLTLPHPYTGAPLQLCAPCPFDRVDAATP